MTSVDKIMDLGVKSVWIHVPAQPLNCCVTADKILF